MPNEEVWVIIGKRLSVEIRVPNFTQSDHRRSPPPCTHRNLSSNRVKVVLCIVISRPTLLLHSQTCRAYAKCPPECRVRRVLSSQAPARTHKGRAEGHTHTQRSAPHPLLNAQRLHTKANTSRVRREPGWRTHTHTHTCETSCMRCMRVIFDRENERAPGRDMSSWCGVLMLSRRHQ